MPLQRLGRDQLFRTPEHFDMLVDNYILECEHHNNPPGLAGLVLYLGIQSRKLMDAFITAHPEYAGPYARGRTLCEMQLEAYLAVPQANTAGIQHLLKTLHDHKETAIVETAPLTVVIEGKDAKL